jgi:multiple sugar transport system permease protein
MIRDLEGSRPLPAEAPTQHEVDHGFSRWIHDLSRVSHHFLTLGAAALFVIPLVWMLGASLRQRGLAPPSQLEWIPNPLVFSNYSIIFDLLPLGDYLLNSLKVVAVAVPLTILTASWAGFAMAQLAPRPRNALLLVSLATLMIPVTALWIPRFLIYKWMGILDSLWSLIIPSVMGSSPFYVLLFYWAFTRIPRETFEAARLDGAGAFRIWGSIAMPQVRPAIMAVSVLTFVLYWSNFLDPLLYLSSQTNYTLPVALQALKQMVPTDFPVMMAGAVFITLPVIIMFFIAQRYFLQDRPEGTSWLDRGDTTGRRSGSAISRSPGAISNVGAAAFALLLPAAREAVSWAGRRRMVAALRRGRVQGRLHRALRVFMALIIFTTLTMTVMQREDHDGYQATHLFFMPRETWEMDEGRGMLYEEEHYAEVAEAESAGAGYTSTGSSVGTTGPSVRRAPRTPNLQGNQIPVETMRAQPQGLTWRQLPIAQQSERYIPWLPEVPTPPPRLTPIPT